MCSIVAVYINELNLIVFMIYKPPPVYDTIYYGEVLEKSFIAVVIDDIYKLMNDYKSPVPDINLAGDFIFPRSVWMHSIG